MNKEKYIKYIKLMEERPTLYKDSQSIRIEKNIDIINNYEKEHGVEIGIIYKSKYHLLVVDLIYDKNNRYYTYERIFPFAIGKAIVAVVMCDEKYVLLWQYRYPICDYQYAFVRGFGEAMLSGEDNCAKEVLEEVGAQAKNITYLGEVYADSGLCVNSASVYLCNVENINLQDEHEGIQQIHLVSKDKLEEMIIDKKITDGFTLSALKLHQSIYAGKTLL